LREYNDYLERVEEIGERRWGERGKDVAWLIWPCLWMLMFYRLQCQGQRHTSLSVPILRDFCQMVFALWQCVGPPTVPYAYIVRNMANYF
jgi:hypothetical protein